MRKTRTVSFRVAPEMYEVLENVENKTEYVTRLLVKDIDSAESDYELEVKKQGHLLNMRVMGRVSNAIRRYRSISKSCETKAEKKLLRTEIIYAMECEQKLATDKDIKAFIGGHIQRFKDMG